MDDALVGRGLETLGDDPLLVKYQKDWFHIHAYGQLTPFFRGLREGRLLGTRCADPACETRPGYRRGPIARTVSSGPNGWSCRRWARSSRTRPSSTRGRFSSSRRRVRSCADPACETRAWLPPRAHCPDCLQRTEWVELSQVGEIFTHTTIEYPGALFKLSTPRPLISVVIDGVCTKPMSYLLEGTPRIGMPVRAWFRTESPTNTILDLAWVPAGG